MSHHIKNSYFIQSSHQDVWWCIVNALSCNLSKIDREDFWFEHFDSACIRQLIKQWIEESI